MITAIVSLYRTFTRRIPLQVLQEIGGVEITNNSGVDHYDRWLAPEVVDTNKLTKEADIFALAMTMIEVLTRRFVARRY